MRRGRLRDLSERDLEVRRRIGAAIRREREARGKSQRWLAEQLEVTSASMSRIEGGRQVISTDILDRVALALDVSVLALYARYERYRLPGGESGPEAG